MELLPIGQLSKRYGVSTRTLRYYEQIGLLSSIKTDALYRFYDDDATKRLEQIIVLRKLRIPLAQIALILSKGDALTAIEAFRQNLAELDAEIAALSTIRAVSMAFIKRLRESANLDLRHSLFSGGDLRRLVSALTLTKNHFKEDKAMEELDKADQTLSKLSDVRIVYLPPATVASSHHIGPEPENNAGRVLEEFIRSIKLWEIKPDMRSYGFNHPNEVPGTDYHGYEFWVTIPDDLSVPAPLTKKHFPGGLYAAHVIKMGDFHEWGWLWEWAADHPDYERSTADDGGECMFGLLEECLNYANVVRASGIEGHDQSKIQLDLLMPIKLKEK